MNYELVIGLEVHAQLNTVTKLFCSCRRDPSAAPNRNVCVVCSGQPGTLPRLNAEAVRLGALAAMSVGAEVAGVSRFDRKHYFYPDLPKGYQTTQLEQPLATGGGITLGSGKHISFERMHLEEDAGKTTRTAEGQTLIDLNRAGVPLIECVTEPQLHTADEASEFVLKLRERLRFSGASQANMDDGSMRVDVNVSVRPAGGELGTKVELKNLNSVRHIAAAIRFEGERQRARLEGGMLVALETRAWDVEHEESVLLRTKEDAHDYRAMPEPDLAPLVLDQATLAGWRSTLSDSAELLRARWTDSWGLSLYDAEVLTQSQSRARYFEHCVGILGPDHAKLVANWITNDVLAACAGDLQHCPVSPTELASLLVLVQSNELQRSQAKAVLAALWHEPESELRSSPRDLAQRLGFEGGVSASELDEHCRAAIAADPAAVNSVKAGNAKALGALIGPILRATQGKADPERVRTRLNDFIHDARID